MRAEEKELEGPELERAQRLETDVEQGHEELPVLASEEVQDLELAHRGRLFDALQLILARGELNVGLLNLPQRETRALEFLQTAVTGRDVNLGKFVYAEDRSAMLEQALAVLQQNLTHGSSAELAELHGKFDALTSQVAELRDELVNLEEAQDDLIEHREQPKAQVDDSDDVKPPEPVELDESVTGFIASALQALASITKLDETVGESARPSSLEGPERPAKPEFASTLAGPERAEPEQPPSSLGDAKDGTGG